MRVGRIFCSSFFCGFFFFGLAGSIERFVLSFSFYSVRACACVYDVWREDAFMCGAVAVLDQPNVGAKVTESGDLKEFHRFFFLQIFDEIKVAATIRRILSP